MKGRRIMRFVGNRQEPEPYLYKPLEMMGNLLWPASCVPDLELYLDPNAFNLAGMNAFRRSNDENNPTR